MRPIRVVPKACISLTGLLGDAISTIPARFAAMFSGTTGTRMAKLPFESPKISVRLYGTGAMIRVRSTSGSEDRVRRGKTDCRRVESIPRGEASRKETPVTIDKCIV